MKGKRVLVISIVVLALLTVIILPFRSGSGSGRELLRTGEDRIVVIYLTGSIQESAGGGFLTGAITPRYVQNQLNKAETDAAIKGIVLRVESPGGSIAASQEIAALIRNFSKPVVVSMADMAASGGYYISAPAQGIVAQPGTMTGSIGVISTLINTDGLYEMLGLEVETFKSGEHKDMFSRALTDEERQIMQDISDEAYGQFIAEVAAGRGMDLEKVRELATGQLYLGTQALELGLVDRLGGIEEAIAYLAELNDLENPVRYEFPPPSAFSQLFESGYRILVLLEKRFLGPEQLLIETLREGFPPAILYQVR
jgi:protease IV